MTTEVVSKSPSFTNTFYSSLFDVPEGERIKACLQCATCSGVCPFGYLMEYPPGKMISTIRADIFDQVLLTDSVWLCVSCYACTEVCPAKIPLTPGLMTRTKEEMLLAGNVPTELQDALMNTQRYGNPLGESPRKRAAWADGLDPEVTIMRKAKRPVDVLWFVGDYASYHPRVQNSSKSLAKILNALNYQFNQIITTDPHAYNAIKNEYPELGISYPVQHVVEFLVERLDQLKPLLKQELNARITYHDPCYLGRANGIYDAPRLLLEQIPGVELVEMSHNRTTSICCGGGGGGMWLDGYQWEKAHVRMSEWRIREAVTAGADILAVACPYETPRFEDAAKMVQGAGKLAVKDITELLSEAMEE
jgi:Fe-S oxidoreductase